MRITDSLRCKSTARSVSKTLTELDNHGGIAPTGLLWNWVGLETTNMGLLNRAWYVIPESGSRTTPTRHIESRHFIYCISKLAIATFDIKSTVPGFNAAR
jgi:hypothetical protein